jgi:aspartate kinase
MKVFKFGGGIIKDPDSVKRIPEVLKLYDKDDLLIVVSAMNKMTNAFEKLVLLYYNNQAETEEQLNSIISYHEAIARALFPSESHSVHEELEGLSASLRSYLSTRAVPHYDFEYDQVVPYGELFSSLIVHHQLAEAGIPNRLLDARQLILTDNAYRHAIPDILLASEAVRSNLGGFYRETKDKEQGVALTQGFIGGANNQHTTTLGREGSDYTAGLLAWILDAEEVVIWKDVPGVLSADPHQFQDVVKLDKMSYKEALELAFYGAKVIHPKTIRPLQNKDIPLRVRSFYELDDPGTLISKEAGESLEKPSIIIKKNQLLISIYPPDVSLLTSEHLGRIFHLLHKNGNPVNVIQNSASSFSVCMDDPDQRHDSLLRSLQESFRLKFNEGLHLITIRNFNQSCIKDYIGNQTIFLEQRSRTTAQFVVDPITDKT